MTYGELVAYHEQQQATEVKWTLNGFLQCFAYYGLLPLILFGMVVKEWRGRKKKNAYNKARLKDL